MATRKELIETVGARYRAGTVAERSAILDEFVAITGYHRKHAMRLLSRPVPEPQKRRPSVRYGPAVREALSMLREVSDRVCSKRLKAMIPVLLPALVRHGKLDEDAALHAQLAEVSPATIDERIKCSSRPLSIEAHQPFLDVVLCAISIGFNASDNRIDAVEENVCIINNAIVASSPLLRCLRQRCATGTPSPTLCRGSSSLIRVGESQVVVQLRAKTPHGLSVFVRC
jgi:hypothetical protein